MNKTNSELKACEKALKLFDKWNDVTGFVDKGTGYYYELKACIEDGVKIGFQASNEQIRLLKELIEKMADGLETAGDGGIVYPEQTEAEEAYNKWMEGQKE
jgi:hypothetical protein